MLQFCHLLWMGVIFYSCYAWLPGELQNSGTQPMLVQAMVATILLLDILGEVGTGYLADKGLCCMSISIVTMVVGEALLVVGCVVVFNAKRLGATWALLLPIMFCIGVLRGMIPVVPLSIFKPEVRVTGYSFAYNLAMGVFGGLTPMIIQAMSGTSFDPYMGMLYWTLVGAFTSITAALVLIFRHPSVQHTRLVSHRRAEYEARHGDNGNVLAKWLFWRPPAGHGHALPETQVNLE